jgi:hypothetical protein
LIVTPKLTWKRAAVTGAAAAVVSASAILIHMEMRRPERDRHRIIASVRQTEAMIRRHDVALFSQVEGTHPRGSPRPEPDAAHEGMLRDFERLSHLENFQMNDIHAVVDGDTAIASYVVLGKAGPPHHLLDGQRPATVPGAGEIYFRRRGEDWEMVGHRFIP